MAPTSSSPTSPDLPLGWTRIKRPSHSECEDSNCADPSCRRRRRRRPAPFTSETLPLPVPTTKNAVASVGRTFTGQAIFCLTEQDPAWFQGYFFLRQEQQRHGIDDCSPTTTTVLPPLVPNNNKSPWGLLCRQQDIDDCLQCDEGGYREITVTIYPFGKNNGATNATTTVANVQWTGGDMMRLLHPSFRFEPQKVLTGDKACPLVETVFTKLIAKLKAREKRRDQDSTDSILNFLPDVAIVSGKLEMMLTESTDEDEGSA